MLTEQELRSALRQAYLLGQVYWQQVDSEFFTQHRKANETQGKFNQLVEDSVTKLNGATSQ